MFLGDKSVDKNAGSIGGLSSNLKTISASNSGRRGGNLGNGKSFFSISLLLNKKPGTSKSGNFRGIQNTVHFLDEWYYLAKAGPLGLMVREPACQTSESSSNPSWDATVHPVCETFNVMCVV